jgi:hypothetical protein
MQVGSADRLADCFRVARIVLVAPTKGFTYAAEISRTPATSGLSDAPSRTPRCRPRPAPV